MAELLERYRWLIVGLFAVPLLSGIVLLVEDRLDDPPGLVVQNGDTSIADVRVFVSGAVQNPGVYSVPDGSRWIDALDAAGGATDDANLDGLNLARRVSDEDQILVPILGGALVAGASQSPLTNINTASATELESLPGIGEVRASTIIRSRETDGLYGSIDDLRDRDLIPDSVFDDIADLITVAP